MRRLRVPAALAALLVGLLPALAGAQTRYHFEPLPKSAADLAKRFTPAQIEVLEMVNRRDRAHLLRADPPVPGLVVPDTWEPDVLAYSPFPAV